jgi:hypothetical protein
VSPELDLGKERERGIVAFNGEQLPGPINGTEEDKTIEREVQENHSTTMPCFSDLHRREHGRPVTGSISHHCPLYTKLSPPTLEDHVHIF